MNNLRWLQQKTLCFLSVLVTLWWRIFATKTQSHEGFTKNYKGNMLDVNTLIILFLNRTEVVNNLCWDVELVRVSIVWMNHILNQELFSNSLFNNI